MFTNHTCDCQEPKHENLKMVQEVVHDFTALNHVEVLRLAVADRLTARLNALRYLSGYFSKTTSRVSHTGHSIPRGFSFRHV